MTHRWDERRGWVIDRRDYWSIQGNDLATWTVERPETKQCRGCSATLAASDPDLCETCDLHRADLAADPEPEPIRIVSHDGASTMEAVREREVVALLKWSGDVLKVFFPGGTILGRLYRSSGKRRGEEITYTFRAWTASDRLECKPTDTEVARGVSLPGAVAALLQHAANASRQAELFTIGGLPACGEPVEGGRCGRAPGHFGHPHIKEPGTES